MIVLSCNEYSIFSMDSIINLFSTTALKIYCQSSDNRENRNKICLANPSFKEPNQILLNGQTFVKFTKSNRWFAFLHLFIFIVFSFPLPAHLSLDSFPRWFRKLKFFLSPFCFCNLSKRRQFSLLQSLMPHTLVSHLHFRT